MKDISTVTEYAIFFSIMCVVAIVITSLFDLTTATYYVLALWVIGMAIWAIAVFHIMRKEGY